jgi:hypothetical protein
MKLPHVDAHVSNSKNTSGAYGVFISLIECFIYRNSLSYCSSSYILAYRNSKGSTATTFLSSLFFGG